MSHKVEITAFLNVNLTLFPHSIAVYPGPSVCPEGGVCRAPISQGRSGHQGADTPGCAGPPVVPQPLEEGRVDPLNKPATSGPGHAAAVATQPFPVQGFLCDRLCDVPCHELQGGAQQSLIWHCGASPQGAHMPNRRPLEMPLLITAVPRTTPKHTVLIPLVHSGSFRLSLVT